MQRIHEEVRLQCMPKSDGPGLGGNGVEESSMNDGGIRLLVRRILTKGVERALEQSCCSIMGCFWRLGLAGLRRAI